MSPPPASASASILGPDEFADGGFDFGTCLGVNPRDTSFRKSVCTGGSCITIGGLSVSPMLSSSP